jgi:type VI secretion system secreted protein Hcp
MRFNGYIQIDGVKGESTDSDHKDWIEILSVSNLHPIQPPKPPTSKVSSSTGAKSSFSVTKLVDKSSPKLYQAVSSGKHLPKVIIELYRASGGSKLKYLTINVNQVLISNISTPRQSPETSGPGTVVTPALLAESVTFNYGNIEWEYT